MTFNEYTQFTHDKIKGPKTFLWRARTYSRSALNRHSTHYSNDARNRGSDADVTTNDNDQCWKLLRNDTEKLTWHKRWAQQEATPQEITWPPWFASIWCFLWAGSDKTLHWKTLRLVKLVLTTLHSCVVVSQSFNGPFSLFRSQESSNTWVVVDPPAVWWKSRNHWMGKVWQTDLVAHASPTRWAAQSAPCQVRRSRRESGQWTERISLMSYLLNKTKGLPTW